MRPSSAVVVKDVVVVDPENALLSWNVIKAMVRMTYKSDWMREKMLEATGQKSWRQLILN